MPELKPGPKRLLRTALIIALFNVFVVGCVHVGFAQRWHAQSEVCRNCHAPDGAGGARDLSSIYDDPMSHHAVGVSYPLGANAYPIFNLPTGQAGDVAFFDRNENGRPDADEIRLYGTNINMTVECASCHIEHGGNQGSAHARSISYLRVPNAGSALCMTCHRE